MKQKGANRNTDGDLIKTILTVLGAILLFSGSAGAAADVLRYTDFVVAQGEPFVGWHREIQMEAYRTKAGLIHFVAGNMVSREEFELAPYQSKTLEFDETIEIQHLVEVIDKEDVRQEISTVRVITGDKFDILSSRSETFQFLKNKYYCEKFGKNHDQCDHTTLVQNADSGQMAEYCRKQRNSGIVDKLPTEDTAKQLIGISYVTSFFLSLSGSKQGVDVFNTLTKSGVSFGFDEKPEAEKDQLCESIIQHQTTTE